MPNAFGATGPRNFTARGQRGGIRVTREDALHSNACRARSTVSKGKITRTPLRVLDIGGGDGMRARAAFPGAEVVCIDKREGWDVRYRGLPPGPWDVLYAHHVVEHLEDVDAFLDECQRVMGAHTVLNVGMPNLAAWFNRLFFLFGYVPHSMELSTRYNVGKPFGWNMEELGGHLRVFTVPAFCQLLTHHGFTVEKVVGEASNFPCPAPVRWVDAVLTKLSPGLASAFRVYATWRK